MKLYHAHIYPMDREPIENGWVSIQDGKITELGQGEIVPGPEDRDLAGGMLLPGFVDAHTHLGIIENGIGFEGDDCNEASDPFTPQLRAIDGINPMDRCFAEARRRGITAVLSSPGSANACGGQIAAIKTAGRRIDSMLIRTAGVKFALGENPKSVYNDRDETPITRMATAALIREGLAAARRYRSDLAAHEADPENLDAPEFDAKHEALLPLLRGECKAFFHCHRADDMFTALRIAKEFSLDPVLIHGTEGHLIADLLAPEKNRGHHRPPAVRPVQAGAEPCRAAQRRSAAPERGAHRHLHGSSGGAPPVPAPVGGSGGEGRSALRCCTVCHYPGGGKAGRH